MCTVAIAMQKKCYIVQLKTDAVYDLGSAQDSDANAFGIMFLLRYSNEI